MLNLEIITPEQTVVKEEVDMVEAKGANGEFGILPGHTQFLTTLDIGEIRYMKDGVTTYLSASNGFAEVVEDKVVMLLDTAEPARRDRYRTGKEGYGTSGSRRLRLSLSIMQNI